MDNEPKPDPEEIKQRLIDKLSQLDLKKLTQLGGKTRDPKEKVDRDWLVWSNWNITQ